ncbi:MAG: type II toxin-antitoxin system RelE/ParE family toxin [Bacteroidales bacterium]|nr:type II toxin-antitoxin system RelE/ParE family toxin [Bacteroidales bacterium]
MNVIWTEFATEELLNTSLYLLENFGEKTHEKFIQKIERFEKLITLMPEMGKVEPFLEDEVIVYRSFVVTSVNKIVYYIDGEDIVVADFWNMRRNPKTLAGRLVRPASNIEI